MISAVEQELSARPQAAASTAGKAGADDTTAVLEMTKVVKTVELDFRKSAPEESHRRCMRVSRVANSVYKRYSDCIPQE